MEKTTKFVKGKVYWCKLLGDPVPNYDRDGHEWTVEFEPEDTTFLKETRLLDRLKNKYEDRAPYLNLRRKALTADGEKMEPVLVFDSNNEPWDRDTLIGNGSKVDMKLSIVDYGRGKKAGIYINAMRVTELVPYVRNAFAGMDNEASSESATLTKKAPARKSAPVFDDLDDEIPFD